MLFCFLGGLHSPQYYLGTIYVLPLVSELWSAKISVQLCSKLPDLWWSNKHRQVLWIYITAVMSDVTYCGDAVCIFAFCHSCFTGLILCKSIEMVTDSQTWKKPGSTPPWWMALFSSPRVEYGREEKRREEEGRGKKMSLLLLRGTFSHGDWWHANEYLWPTSGSAHAKPPEPAGPQAAGDTRGPVTRSISA